VLYLIFNEGYSTSGGAHLHRTALSDEAIRLTRATHELLPNDGEVVGLLALMLLTDARRAARTGPSGELIPLDEQDRSLWNQRQIDEGVALVSSALSRGSVGVYQLQAAIAALHDEARRVEDTDWPQILALYTVLEKIADNPMATLSRAIATAMVHGPEIGLEMLKDMDEDARMRGSHRLDAVRAHLYERAGDRTRALDHYRAAAERTMSLPERNYLLTRAARLANE
jgi:predicted RNA polymerase sigma factor